MQNAQQQNPVRQNALSTVSWWLFLVRVAAVSVEVFLHKRLGSRYCRAQAAMVVPLGVIYAWAWNFSGYRIEPVMYFFGAYLVALVISQIAILIRIRRGDQEHSMYSGYPWMLRPSLAARELRIKLWFEPFLVGLIGVLVNELDKPLGVYLMIAGCSLFINNALAALWRRRQVVDLQDAVFEQSHLAGTFRGQ